VLIWFSLEPLAVDVLNRWARFIKVSHWTGMTQFPLSKSGELMQDGVFQVLFLSRRNSARSIMAQAILNKVGKGRFKAFSAAVDPAASIEPVVVALLKAADLTVDMTKPQHFDEFLASDAVELDFVFTLSDTAAGEKLPEWPGLPITAHWRCPDPVLATGEDWERRQAFT
jgi:arsenate reductase (thioredoxin)